MPKQEIKIVLGLMFGDEGKGNTVQYLCRQAQLEGKSVAVIRFSGGPQAAHRVKYKNKEHICSSYGAGCLLGIPTYWICSDNTFIDPIAVMEERKHLLQIGIDMYPQIVDVEHTRWITPYDIIANQNDEKVLKDGTCGKGIFNTFKRNCFGYHNNPDKLLEWASNFWKIERNEYWDRRFKQSFYQLLSRQNNIPLSSYDVLIYEGSQGVLLDKDSEFFPNVTPSKTDLTKLDIPNEAELYLCSRLYLTRHGNGYVPKISWAEYFFNIEDICNPPNKFQGTMKYGIFDISLYSSALSRLNLKNSNPKLVFTHCDTVKDKMLYLDESDIVNYTSLDEFFNIIKNKFNYPIVASFSDRSNLFIQVQYKEVATQRSPCSPLKFISSGILIVSRALIIWRYCVNYHIQ